MYSPVECVNSGDRVVWFKTDAPIVGPQVSKSSAEEYCMKLQKAGLTISVAPDSSFEKDGTFKAPEGGKK
jgi:hypothetical protein